MDKMFRPAGRGTLPAAAKYPKRHRGLVGCDLAQAPHHIHPAPRTPEKTVRQRRIFLASGAMVTGLCKRRSGCRPARFNRFIFPIEQSACCGGYFVPAPITVHHRGLCAQARSFCGTDEQILPAAGAGRPGRSGIDHSNFARRKHSTDIGSASPVMRVRGADSI